MLDLNVIAAGLPVRPPEAGARNAEAGAADGGPSFLEALTGMTSPLPSTDETGDVIDVADDAAAPAADDWFGDDNAEADAEADVAASPDATSAAVAFVAQPAIVDIAPVVVDAAPPPADVVPVDGAVDAAPGEAAGTPAANDDTGAGAMPSSGRRVAVTNRTTESDVATVERESRNAAPAGGVSGGDVHAVTPKSGARPDAARVTTAAPDGPQPTGDRPARPAAMQASAQDVASLDAAPSAPPVPVSGATSSAAPAQPASPETVDGQASTPLAVEIEQQLRAMAARSQRTTAAPPAARPAQQSDAEPVVPGHRQDEAVHSVPAEEMPPEGIASDGRTIGPLTTLSGARRHGDRSTTSRESVDVHSSADAPLIVRHAADAASASPQSVSAATPRASVATPATVTVSADSDPVDVLPSSTGSQIVQAIRLQALRDGGQAHIRLDPAQFGEVTVRVRVEQRQVVADIEADSPVVREWIQGNQHVLRQALSGQQLTLDRIEVHEPASTSEPDTRRDGSEAGGDRESSSRQRRERRSRGDEPQFEVFA